MLSIISAQLAPGSRVRRRRPPEVNTGGRAAIRRARLSCCRESSNVDVAVAVAVAWNAPAAREAWRTRPVEDVVERDDHYCVVAPMNRTLGLQLTVYSLLLPALSVLAHSLSPELARATLIVGCVGGGLCLLWAVRAIRGRPGKAPSLLTLVPVTFALLSQTVLAWAADPAEFQGRAGIAVLLTSLTILSFAMLMRIAYAGAFAPGQVTATASLGTPVSRVARPTPSSLQTDHGA